MLSKNWCKDSWFFLNNQLFAPYFFEGGILRSQAGNSWGIRLVSIA